MFAGMVRILPARALSFACYTLLTKMIQIFRKEPFFHGHDNYDQVRVYVELRIDGAMFLSIFF